MCAPIFLYPINPPWRGRKDTIKRTIKISLKLPCQMGHMLGDQKEGGKQVAPFVEKRKGCVCTYIIGEGPNGRCSKDLTPKSKPKSWGGKGGQIKNRKT
jgi:hypothetical protein